MSSELLIAVIGLIGTAWAAWMTYRGVVTRTRQDTQAQNFTFMQEEINRLRDDLVERDKLAREDHRDLLQLRQEVQHLTAQLHELRRLLAVFQAGSISLYGQLVDNSIPPVFDPTAVPVPDDLRFQ